MFIYSNPTVSKFHLLSAALAIVDLHHKNYKSSLNYNHMITNFSSFVKHLGKIFRSYTEFLLNWCYTFSRILKKKEGISHSVVCSGLVYKFRKARVVRVRVRVRVKSPNNFIASGTKIVKRLRRRQYDPNLYRGDKVLSFVPSDCQSGLLQPLYLRSRTDWAEHSLLLRMLLIFLI